MARDVLKFCRKKWGLPLVLIGACGIALTTSLDSDGWGVLVAFGMVVIGIAQLLLTARRTGPDVRTPQDKLPTSLGNPNHMDFN